jgi:hypothetical protein
VNHEIRSQTNGRFYEYYVCGYFYERFSFQMRTKSTVNTLRHGIMDGSMKREAMRRSSVEVQQLATWKQQQTMQEIQQLKLNSSLEIKRSVSPVEQSKDNIKNKFLAKMSARKLKSEMTQNSQPMALNFDQIKHDADSKEYHSKMKHSVAFDVATPGSPPRNSLETSYTFGSSALSTANQNNEVDVLMTEKRYFLSRLNDDNDKMVQLLEVKLFELISIIY